MIEKDIILSLQKRWKALSLCSLALIAFAFAILLITCLHQLFQYSFYWILPAWVIVFLLAALVKKSWQIKAKDVTAYLNRNIPHLEESSELLLKPYQSLNLLEQLQVNKLKENVQYALSVHPVNRKLKTSILFLVIAFIGAALLFLFAEPVKFQQQKNIVVTNVPTQPQKVLPGIMSAIIKIIPPAYTGKQIHRQNEFNILAEEGAQITWEIKITKPAQNFRLQFNDTTTLQLHATNDEHTSWGATKKITRPGFYQLKIDDQLSDLYKLEMIKDQPPVISVQSPKPSTVIDFGEPQKVMVHAGLSDDYGISNASILATVASGSGETVKFKEQEIKFANSFAAHDKKYELKKNIDLPYLGMKPGDELYLYIKATDNHQQEVRSDMYIVSITDTAELMSLDAVINGINLKPEYFRSERQIIIETEQLLKDKAAITEQAFNNKSNDLGIDQKLLRLRYGKFLGEEFEANIGEHAEDEHPEEGKPKEPNPGFGNGQEVLEAFSHKHDMAEDATFFDAGTKRQLRAVLAEMWKAELKLRTFKPEEALPFEYKALRLLKDLQQQSRVYVAKTNIKTPTLKPENRLSGELDKITSPVTKKNMKQTASITVQLQQALSIFETLKTGTPISENDIILLQEAIQLITKEASASPGQYLSSLQSYQRILNNLRQKRKIDTKDISTVQQALQKILEVPARKPVRSSTIDGNNLSMQYFLNLDRNRQ